METSTNVDQVSVRNRSAKSIIIFINQLNIGPWPAPTSILISRGTESFKKKLLIRKLKYILD